MKIIKVPRINALGLKGPEKAPDVILAGLGFDAGEIKVDNSNVQKSHEVIYQRAKEIFSEKEKVAFVGGDHSISAPILKGFGEVYGFENSFLIMFDAHADCMEPMQEPTHEELFRSAIEYGFKPENVVLVGVRKIEPEEQKFLDENKVKIFLGTGNLEETGDYLTEKIKGKDVYVSVDMDVLNPSVVEGVNVPEENGMSEKGLFSLLEKVLPVAKAIDVVEVVPEKDVDGKTVEIAVKILSRFVG
jgi:agmatinase